MNAASKRSIAQHRRFFAVIKAAHDHWPESHPFQPDSSEHLRAWLLVRAKHCDIKSFDMTNDASEAAKLLPIITAVMLRKHCWARANGSELQVCVPRSIAITGEHAVGHLEFCDINRDVDDIIRAETGLDPDQLLRERERAA